MPRTAKMERTTKETQIKFKIRLDGKGESKISTGVGFLNHMLDLFSKHSQMDLSLNCIGDLEVDAHHTTEDIAIVMGSTLRQALGDKKGIERYGDMILPMDETLVLAAVDLSDRACLVYEVPESFRGKIGNFDCELIQEFMSAFANNLRANIHIKIITGGNKHHIAEGIFKALARALKKATRITGEDIPSTKGIL